jgi:hypothetical protein
MASPGVKANLELVLMPWELGEGKLSNYIYVIPVTFIQDRPPGCFMHVSIPTPIAPALKNCCT